MKSKPDLALQTIWQKICGGQYKTINKIEVAYQNADPTFNQEELYTKPYPKELNAIKRWMWIQQRSSKESQLSNINYQTPKRIMRALRDIEPATDQYICSLWTTEKITSVECITLLHLWDANTAQRFHEETRRLNTAGYNLKDLANSIKRLENCFNKCNWSEAQPNELIYVFQQQLESNWNHERWKKSMLITEDNSSRARYIYHASRLWTWLKAPEVAQDPPIKQEPRQTVGFNIFTYAFSS